MRGNSIMAGYHNMPEETEEAFQGGWFHSGDLAVWHPDGYVELRDRAKDIIISGGENISSIEIEQALAKHPAVFEAAVVAMPDEKWGERPKAFVELNEGEDAERGGHHRVLPRAPRALQVPRGGGVRRAAAHLDGQGREVRPARARVGRLARRRSASRRQRARQRAAKPAPTPTSAAAPSA